MTGKQRAGAEANNRLDKILGALLLVPFFTVVMGVAGALLAAMLFSVFSLNLQGIRRAAGMVMQAVFTTGFIDALGVIVPVGVPAGIIAGCITFLINLFPGKKSKASSPGMVNGLLLFLGFGMAATLCVMVLAYFCFVLYAMFQAALLMSRWGCFIGAGAGAGIGIAAGLFLVGDRGSRVKPISGNKKRRGADPADLDWWRADINTDNDVDQD